MCYCTRKQKMNFEGFTQNSCYGNQPQPFEVVFYSIDANTSCSFTKQDLTVKQAYRASFCFVLCYEPKFWQLTLISSAFYSPFFEITLFHTPPLDKSPLSRDRSSIVTIFLVYSITTLIVFN